jgi:hypothetical protein
MKFLYSRNFEEINIVRSSRKKIFTLIQKTVKEEISNLMRKNENSEEKVPCKIQVLNYLWTENKRIDQTEYILEKVYHSCMNNIIRVFSNLLLSYLKIAITCPLKCQSAAKCN